jgi:nitrogen regulatory protein P-II 1
MGSGSAVIAKGSQQTGSAAIATPPSELHEQVERLLPLARFASRGDPSAQFRGTRAVRWWEPMRKIEAILDPDQLDAVNEALGLIGVRGMTASEVKAGGEEGGPAAVYRGHRYSVPRPKVRLEVVVEDDLADAVVRRIVVTANRGRTSDGTITVIPLADVIRIRTGERGPDAV